MLVDAFGVIGVLAALILWRALRVALRSGDWDLSATFVFVNAWLVSGPLTLASMSGGVLQRTDFLGQSVTGYPYWYPTLAKLSGLACIGFSILVIYLMLIRRRGALNRTALLALALGCYCALVGMFHGDHVLTLPVLTFLTSLVTVVILPGGRGAAVGAAAYAATQLVLGGLLVTVSVEAATIPCRVDKCGPLGVLVSGALGFENAFSLMLAAALPFVWIGFRGASGRWMAVVATLAAVLSGSRTGGLVAAVTFLTLCAVRPRLEAERLGRPRLKAGRLRAAIAALTVLAGIGLGVALPLREAPARDFTARVHIWQIARYFFEQDPWFGHGPVAWVEIVKLGYLPPSVTYSAHNQVLDILFIGGWIGTALFVFLVLRILRAGPLIVTATLLVPAAVGGAIERLWGIGASDWLTFTYLATLLVVAPHWGEPGQSECSSPGKGEIPSQRHMGIPEDEESGPRVPSAQSRDVLGQPVISVR